VNRDEGKRILTRLPAEVASRCKQIGEEIRAQNEEIRDRKVFAARIRICSGYYESERVVRSIASRLLSEIVSTSTFS
jgi:hypothetical protein